MRFPASFKDLSLRDLEVWSAGNGFYPSEVPGFVFEFPSLRRLEVSCHRATSIPSALRELTNLEWLHPGALDELKSFPDLSRLTKLKVLRFSGGDDVPRSLLDSIMPLTWLEGINLTSWGLEELPDGLEQFKNLRKLDLSFNRVATIPNWLLERDLTELNLRYNKLSDREKQRVSNARDQLPLVHSRPARRRVKKCSGTLIAADAPGVGRSGVSGPKLPLLSRSEELVTPTHIGSGLHTLMLGLTLA